MQYQLFVWSTARSDGTAQGVIDFYSRESAVKAYQFIFEIAMQGKDKITCIELYETDGNGEFDTPLYSATFPE